jgi:hypothetical protein
MADSSAFVHVECAKCWHFHNFINRYFKLAEVGFKLTLGFQLWFSTSEARYSVKETDQHFLISSLPFSFLRLPWSRGSLF